MKISIKLQLIARIDLVWENEREFVYFLTKVLTLVKGPQLSLNNAKFKSPK